MVRAVVWANRGPVPIFRTIFLKMCEKYLVGSFGILGGVRMK